MPIRIPPSGTSPIQHLREPQDPKDYAQDIGNLSMDIARIEQDLAEGKIDKQKAMAMMQADINKMAAEIDALHNMKLPPDALGALDTLANSVKALVEGGPEQLTLGELNRISFQAGVLYGKL